MHHFDQYCIDEANLALSKDGRRLEAPPQVIEVLAYLVANRGRTVTRTELIERFWPRAGSGADAALNTCVRRIRALLGDAKEEQRYVQTRPRSGYRFVGAVAERRRQTLRLAIAAAVGALAIAATLMAPWVRDAMARPETASVVISDIDSLCEYTLYANFNAGLRQSLLAETADRLPRGFVLTEQGNRADIELRVTVRQTEQNTVATLLVVRMSDGGVLAVEEFVEPTRRDDYVPTQRALAERLSEAVASALVNVSV